MTNGFIMTCSRCTVQETNQACALCNMPICGPCLHVHMTEYHQNNYHQEEKMNLTALQKMIGDWADHNGFGTGDTDLDVAQNVMGVCEEAGELAHAILKMQQGIRGTKEKHMVDAQDAVGDITIYLIHLCARMGWSFEKVLDRTVCEVLKRDFKKNPQDGRVEGE